MAEKIPFKVSTSVKTIVGKELVTNPNIAIFELVKNSYDAFASEASIIFKEVRAEGHGRIIIADDGSGMSKPDLVGNWLFLGYSDKREEETTTKKPRGALGKRRRVFAGAKGIGRFSCDTLGAVLTLHTKTKDEQTIHRLDIDWKKFEADQSQQFQNMKATYTREHQAVIEGFDLSKMKSGTILEIGELRNQWGVKELRELKRYLQRLINPSFTGSSAGDFKIIVKAEEFAQEDSEAEARSQDGLVKINGPVENFVFEKLGIKTTFIQSRIHGNRIWTQLTDKDRLVFEMNEKNTYPELQDVESKIFFLNRSAKNLFSRAMGLHTKEYGSVFLYKNQFRIHPYGDEGDDWLGLEERKGQGVRRYLSKRDIIGAVVVKGSDPIFKEVSSRDAGLIHNKAYVSLYEYVKLKVFRRLERYVEGVISFDTRVVEATSEQGAIEEKSLDLVKKLIEGTGGPETTIKVGPQLLQIVDESFIDKFPTIMGNLQSIGEHITDDAQLKTLNNTVRVIRRTLAKSESEKAKITSALAAKEQEVVFLRKTLTPEQEQLLGHVHSIKLSAQEIQRRLEELRRWAVNSNVPANAADVVDDCAIEAQKILTLSRMATAANFDLGEEEIETDAVNFLHQYFKHFGRSAKDVLTPIRIFNDNLVFVTKLRPPELAIVVDNLLDNSRKNGASTVSVKFEVSGKKLHMYFGDDGRGIDSETADHIFDMGYSTTGGSGLGLYECKKIMDRLGGSISFVGNDKEDVGSGACFEVVMP